MGLASVQFKVVATVMILGPGACSPRGFAHGLLRPISLRAAP